jgi:hypothetical protein
LHLINTGKPPALPGRLTKHIKSALLNGTLNMALSALSKLHS